jgi:hypothetical protein
MTKYSVFAATFAFAVAVAPAARAQGTGTTTVPTTDNPVELGIDAGVSFGLDDPHVTTVSIPGQHIRAGFFFGRQLEFEPSFGLDYIHASGVSQTRYEALVGMLYHFTPNRRASQLYVRPFVGFLGTNIDGSNETQAALGGGVGLKVPMYPRLSARFEANYTHTFSSGDADASNAIGLLAGLSFFTR